MQYVTEFRDREKAQAIAEEIRREAKPDKSYRFMEFCGGHTHVLARWGLTELLPANVKMIHRVAPCAYCPQAALTWRLSFPQGPA